MQFLNMSFIRFQKLMNQIARIKHENKIRICFFFTLCKNLKIWQFQNDQKYLNKFWKNILQVHDSVLLASELIRTGNSGTKTRQELNFITRINQISFPVIMFH